MCVSHSPYNNFGCVGSQGTTSDTIEATLTGYSGLNTSINSIRGVDSIHEQCTSMILELFVYKLAFCKKMKTLIKFSALYSNILYAENNSSTYMRSQFVRNHHNHVETMCISLIIYQITITNRQNFMILLNYSLRQYFGARPVYR